MIKIINDTKPEKRPKIYIIDVTNRDGVQAHGIYISDFERTMINYYLNQMGIYQSEFGFPAKEDEKGYINTNIELGKEGGPLYPMVLEGWIRAIKEDVEKAVKYTNIEHLNLSISTSQIMIKGKFGDRKDEKDIIEDMVKAVKTAKGLGIKTVGVNAEDASRTRHFQDQSYLIDFSLAAKETGADRIRYCDTLGYDGTSSIKERVYNLAKEVQLPIELHCHNDLGYAVANSVEGAIGALNAGVDAYINTTINGYGERAGNADLVSVLLAIKFSSSLIGKDFLDPNIKLDMSYKICNYVSLATRIPIPPNQPGVGSNAFAHESGIHADGMIKNRKNYELYSPKILGIPQKEIVETGRIIAIGDYSGRKGLMHVCKEHNIEVKDADKLLKLVSAATKKSKRKLTIDELEFLSKYSGKLGRLLKV